MKTSKQRIMRESKLLAKEVIGWKWLQHDNILPFIGVVLEPPRFSIISERMENGNVMDFIKTRPNHNRLRLVSERMGPGPDCVPTIWSAFRRRNRPKIPTRSRHHSWGFEGCKLVSFLKVYPNAESTQANILVDSTHRARLADFGLATAIDESIPGSSTNHDGVGGTLRWMAPEVLYPNKFGFARGSKKVLPSRSTDVYAFGMTILEVGAASRSFIGTLNDSLGRSSPDPLPSVACRPRLLRTTSSKGSVQTDHAQDFRTSCGDCWRPLGFQSMHPDPPSAPRFL